MNIQATGSFNFSGAYDNSTASIVINGVIYSQSILSTQTIADIVQQFNTYINTQSTFTSYFTSTYDSSNIYITTISGGRYDGDAGNAVAISSPQNGSGTTYVQATGSVNTFATQSPQYGNSTLIVGPFTTTIFCDAFSDQSAAIASTLNANSSFAANFVASSSENFVVHFTTKATGAYSGSAGNSVALSISPYGSASGTHLTGGSTISSIIITPSGATLTGGVNYNNEVFNLFGIVPVTYMAPAQIIPNPKYNIHMDILSYLDDLHITSQLPANIPTQPVYHLNMDIFSDGLVEWLSQYLLNYLIAKGICQPINTGDNVTTKDGIVNYTFSGDEGIKDFKNGFYYRIPLDANNSVQNQPTPQYLNQIPLPFTAFLYPITDTNYGKMLVKTFTAMSSLPSGVTSVTQIQAQQDLQNNVFTIFAL